MNEELKLAFSAVKPLCDSIMMCPTEDNIKVLDDILKQLKNSTVQELQLYILYPILTHINSGDKKEKIRISLLNVMHGVLEKIIVTKCEMFNKYHACLMGLFVGEKCVDKLSTVPEEEKHIIVKCLTTLMLNLSNNVRIKVFTSYKPLLAQTIYISVQIAKLEQLRALKVSAIECISAYSGIHEYLETVDVTMEFECYAVDLVSSILPGVCGALHEITQAHNPGHEVIVASLKCLHNIIVLAMNNKHLKCKGNVTTVDFTKMMQDLDNVDGTPAYMDEEELNRTTKYIQRGQPEWFTMSGNKLKILLQFVVKHHMHEHWKVRHELAVLCSRILKFCSITMQPSLPIILDILITLSRDLHHTVSTFAATELKNYFRNIPPENVHKIMDSVADSFITTLSNLPTVLNNINEEQKLSNLALLRGYLVLLCDSCRPQRLTQMLTLQNTLLLLCRALLQTAKMETHQGLLAEKYIDSSSYAGQKSPWCKLKNIDKTCEMKLIDICHLLGKAEGVDLVADQLLDMFTNSLEDRKETIYILNHICEGTDNLSLVKRVLDTYLDPDVWYLPYEFGNTEDPITTAETLDVQVYNPRSWEKDSVPGLYEGAIETRYTDISYQVPRTQRTMDPTKCSNILVAIENMITSCLLTSGVGVIALKIQKEFQLYLLKTLCLILERIGSKYEMLHLSGTRAIKDIASACGFANVSQLICANADYFTYQVTTRLKKVWNNQSALEILTVVMNNSDATIFDCLYGIVNDVLVQSCDKYHKNDLSLYLQVFFTFITCINKWFPDVDAEDEQPIERDTFDDVMEFIKNTEISKMIEYEEEGKSAEEMYREDEKKRQEELLNYDDKVTEEPQPPPRHITITVTILKRCINFVPSKRRMEQLLALDILNVGLKVLRKFENELLPLVHLIWSPFVVRFEVISEPIVMRRAFLLLITMGEVSKEFVSSRIVKEVLPQMYNFLQNSSTNSHLKDVGSAYRDSQAYKLQLSMLEALSTLIVDLNLAETNLENAMNCVRVYLSNKQPIPLQELAVKFFRASLEHDIGATYYNLREFCENDKSVKVNDDFGLSFEILHNTPFESKNDTYNNNLISIFSDIDYFREFVEV